MDSYFSWRGSRSECQDLQLITASISIYSSHKPIVWFQKIRNIGQESCAVAPTAVRLYTLKHELRLTWEMFSQQIFQQLLHMSHISVDWTSEANYLWTNHSLESVISFQEVNWTNRFAKWSESICICSDCALNESSEVVSQSEKKNSIENMK